MLKKTPDSLMSFRGEFLRANERGELQCMWSASAHFSDWLMVRSQGGVTEVNIINPQASANPGMTCLWSSCD